MQLEGTRFGGKDPYSGQEGAGGFLSQALTLGVTSQISPMHQTCLTKVHTVELGASEDCKGLHNYLDLTQSLCR